MRIAFTIIYEGLHHLQHKEFANKMCKFFDHWVVVEGHSLPFGSTRWCNKLNVPASSQDGTIDFMNELSKSNKNVHFYSSKKYYHGKDDQVNVAIDIVKSITNKCFLWEVDVDEHWELSDIELAESIAEKSNNIGFSFGFNHMVGPNLIAKGEWGSGYLNRLWKWNGQYFKSHEPALLIGQKNVEEIPDVKFEHYSYFFKQDIKFKSLYYSGHQNVYKNIDAVRNAKSFPVHISELFGSDTSIGKSNSFIHKI